jgi:hypothetical protein
MKKPTALTPKSKKLLEERGYIVERVEYWNHFVNRRIDFLGVADLVALNGQEILLVQVTSSANASSHRKKILQSEKLKLWLKAGGKMAMHLWKKKNNRWQVKEVIFLQ